MMQFAINYSREAAALVRRGAIAVDWFKCPDWPDTIAESSRVRSSYVHFALNAGGVSPIEFDHRAIDAMRRETKTPFVNLHLSPKVRDFAGLRDGDDPADVARVRDRLIEDVSRVADRFGAANVIVETVPYGNPAEGFFRAATMPALVRDVCDATGVGFLLDLSHTCITARFLRLDERAFISAFPVDRLRELHVTGLGFIGPILKDHQPMTDADWSLFEWAMGRIARREWATPWCVALEYGGVGAWLKTLSDPVVIERDALRMANIVRTANSAL